jgi:threonine/homoserine/homoserine lactone efflux protein
VAVQLTILGMTFLLMTAVVFALVATTAAPLGNWLHRQPQIASRLNWIAGVAFTFIGLKLVIA